VVVGTEARNATVKRRVVAIRCKIGRDGGVLMGEEDGGWPVRRIDGFVMRACCLLD